MTNDKTVTMSRELAESIAQMVTEWVETGIKLGTDWRNGLPGIIEKRLARFAAPVVERHQHEWDINEHGTATVCSICGIRSSDEPLGVEPNKCGRCSASTTDICNQNGCGFLESGNGEPVVERQAVPDYFVRACDKFDWTPEEALRFYAEGKHFDTEGGRTRILCTGSIASYALKNTGGDYADMKGVERGSAPVAVVPSHKEDLAHDVGYRSGVMHGYKLATEGSEDDYQKCVNRLTSEINAGRRESKHSSAPVMLPGREWGSPYADGWNACLDKVKELNK